ncbi:MAG TPA: VOC family protein [Candidatus Eisenbacteria bacterium]|nr:VOC family protein [Candidatus Eisenbacteria bacterium]
MAAVRYIVKDVDAAVAFYVERLGFELERNFAPAIAILRHGPMQLWVAGPTASASRPMPDGRAPEPGGWNRFVFETRDLAALVSDLRTAGVPFRNDIVTGPGGKQILIEDPSGNPIELFEPA